MVQEKPVGDRRSEVRFEVLGDLWATLTTSQSLPLINVGTGGILIESVGPLVVGSLHRGRLTLGDAVADVAAMVRHVTPTNKRPDRYLVGLEFVDVPSEIKRWIDAVVDLQGPGGAGVVEA